MHMKSTTLLSTVKRPRTVRLNGILSVQLGHFLPRHLFNLCSFLGRGVVDAPLRKVGEFTADIQSTYTWDKFLTVTSIQLYISTLFTIPPSHRVLDV